MKVKQVASVLFTLAQVQSVELNQIAEMQNQQNNTNKQGIQMLTYPLNEELINNASDKVSEEEQDKKMDYIKNEQLDYPENSAIMDKNDNISRIETNTNQNNQRIK